MTKEKQRKDKQWSIKHYPENLRLNNTILQSYKKTEMTSSAPEG